MKDINKIMGNVMAALNSFGIEYDTHFSGVCVKREREELLKRGGNSITYNSSNLSRFEAKLKKFAEEKQYYKIRGAYWAPDNDEHYVIVQLERLYDMTEADWLAYANWCGCGDDIVKAQCEYGDPEPSYIRMNVRIKKGGDIESFVRKVAPYCW